MAPNNGSEDYTVLEQKLREVKEQYDSLMNVVTAGSKTSSEFKEAVIKLRAMDEIISLKNERERLAERIRETSEVLNSGDNDIRELAGEELKVLAGEKSGVEEKIRAVLFPENADNVKNAIVELRAGVGGEEASLFVRDLFRMYSRYSEKKGWAVDVLASHQSGSGFKEIIFLVKGKGAFGDLKYESGVHRVQRVPDTENYGRIHTSAATAAVFPETEEKELKIDPADLKIDTFRSSGAGGQSVNKTSSAVRITHIPTGMVISCQDERSQMQNKAKGLKILRARLQSFYESEKKSKMDSERKEFVGTGERSEKIRTYNFPQNRVTDHRIELTLYNLDRIMEGDMGEFIETLRRRLQ
ncbi:MAG: peptide chain release factor 1 [Candidatus Omnitrophica bacterium]|nr:peptide chain release factor 1 [Candidatus Omnitrophota bacterium]